MTIHGMCLSVLYILYFTQSFRVIILLTLAWQIGHGVKFIHFRLTVYSFLKSRIPEESLYTYSHVPRKDQYILSFPLQYDLSPILICPYIDFSHGTDLSPCTDLSHFTDLSPIYWPFPSLLIPSILIKQNFPIIFYLFFLFLFFFAKNIVVPFIGRFHGFYSNFYQKTWFSFLQFSFIWFMHNLNTLVKFFGGNTQETDRWKCFLIFKSLTNKNYETENYNEIYK